MIVYWLIRVVLHLFAGLLTSAFVFPLTDADGRNRRIKAWSAKLLEICGVRVEVKNADSYPADQHALIVANHISWLDIFVINSLHPCRFVAKSDIRNWPLLGWLCEKSGTIFIARGRQRDVRKTYENLVVSLERGERIAFFPEGTTAAQGEVLNFHPNLFEAAIEAKVPVQAYALRYLDEKGQFHKAVEFIGDMSFAASMISILRNRRIFVQLIRLPAIETEGLHRRDLAVATRAVIIQGLEQ